MRTVVITGAADGIGKALATAFVANGDRVIGVDFDRTRADALQALLGDHISFVIADLSQVVSLETVVQQMGTDIDIVIHNAGISEVGYFKNSNIETQKNVIAVNFTAPMVITRHLLANNALTSAASVVFISSLSHYVSYPSASVYGATKSGLASYARTLSVALPNLHVMTVYPGPTRTAHARRYSPDNSREDKRMSPENLANQIVSGIDRRQRILIPSFGNWIFAIIGRLFPAITNFAMRKTLLEKFEA